MAALVANLDQAAALDNTDMTLAAVAGADYAFPTDGGSQRGIDGTTNCQQLTNEGNSLVADDWYSGYVTFASKDMSSVDQAFCMHFKNNSPDYNTIADIRVALRSGTGTANWGVWNVGASATIKNGSFHPIMMVGTPDSEVGTFDNTDVTGFAFLAQASETGGAFGFQMSVDQLVYINGPARFGDTGSPSTVTLENYFDLLKPTSGTTYHSMLVARAGPTIEFGFPIAIESDDYDDTSAALGIAFKEDDGIAFGVMPAGYYQLDITGQASGSIVIESASLATNSTDFDLTIDGSAASTSVTMTSVLMAGVRNVSITGSGVTMEGCTVASPLTCEIAEGNLDITITDSAAAIDWTADIVAGSTITTDSDIDITFSETDLSDINIVVTANNTITLSPATASGTYTLTGLSRGGATSIEFDNATANNTSLSVSSDINSNNTVASPTSGGGTVTVLGPTDDLTVNSSETGSQIIVFTTNTQTELDSEASASQLVYSHGGETVDITVLKDGFIPFRQTGLVLSGDVTINAQLVNSREYDSGHGLTYTTDASWSRTNNELTVPTFGPTVQGVFSLMMESFRTQTALRNTAFNLEMDGINTLYLVDDAEGNADSSIENMTRGGVGYINSSGTVTAEWFAVLSVGDNTAGETGEYQQIDGSNTTDARATGNFDEIVKMYGDATHGNFDYRGHAVFKYQINGYYQARIDVLDLFGLSTLTPTLYTIPLSPAATGIATGDPAISITITDHTAAPITVGGKSFDYEVVDNGTNSAEDILREINYNLSLDATYQGKDPFNYPDMVIETGGNYESEYGRVEGQDTTTTYHGFYVSRSSSDHPDFTRFQSNDGTYYTPAVQNQATITNLPTASGADTMLQIYNNTTSSEVYVSDPGGATYNEIYTEGTNYSDGDEIRIRFAELDGSVSFKSFETIVTASATGWSLNAANFLVSDSVYATNAVDGSQVTKFNYSAVDDQFNLAVAQNFSAAEVFAFYCSTLTTADGIEGAYGAFVAIDEGNYVNITSIANIYLDNETTASQRQTDSARIYKDDGSYPVLDPTTSGYGIDLNWQNVVYVVSTGGSSLTPSEQAQLTSIQGKTDSLTFTQAGQVDANVKYVHDIEVDGTGTTSDPWGPA